jgi:hypothetical protein
MYLCFSNQSLRASGFVTFEHDHVRSVNRLLTRFSRVGGKVINWYVHLFAFLELLQSFVDQIKVKRVRVVEIVLVSIGQFVLFWCQNLNKEIKSNERLLFCCRDEMETKQRVEKPCRMSPC